MKFDAFREGLGAALEQLDHEGRKTVAFVSRILNLIVSRYRINELEPVGVVWVVDCFKYNLFGQKYTVNTVHPALLTIMKGYRPKNNSYNSTLTHWVYRFLTFNFEIEPLPGTKMGMVGYFLLEHIQVAPQITHCDDQFVVAKPV